MNVMVLVLVLTTVTLGICLGVASYRRRLRLVPLHLKTKGHFVLMVKSDKSREDDASAQRFSKYMGGQAEDNIAAAPPNTGETHHVVKAP